MDASKYNELCQQWLQIGTITGKGPVVRNVFDSPFLTVTFHVLWETLVTVPTSGELTVFGLIRDQQRDFRRVDPSVFGLKFYQGGNNGFSLQYPNGCDGIEIVSTLVNGGIAIDLTNVRARVSGVPSNVRELRF